MKSKNLTLGLSLFGAAGVWLTSWLSIKCHEKAKTKETKTEKILAYSPAIISGVGTTACILGSHSISRKEIAALTGTCTYLAANREKLVEKMRKLIGEEKTNEAQIEAMKEAKKTAKKEHKSGQIVENTEYGNVHFAENVFGREFYCSVEHINWSKKMINELYRQNGIVNMNTLYELWGLKKVRHGYEFGWPVEDDSFGYSLDEPIHIELISGEDENGELMYLIDIRTTPPVQGYLEM